MFSIFKPKSNAKQAADKKVVFKISGMHCVSCSMNIDGELEDMEGVRSATTSYAKATSVVEFDPEKTSVEAIVATVARLGYTLSHAK